jgi:hypothetical protein
MTNSLSLVSEHIRETKPMLRQIEARPNKPAKHRYERRKVRELLRVGDWTAEGAS